MKTYWDSSALVAATGNLDLRSRLKKEGGTTRTHALAEVFSALTGGSLEIRLTADAAAEVVDGLANDLKFVDLNAKETVSALRQARKRGVRGGRVHDYLHAVAAEKAGSTRLLTTDRNDFESLADSLEIEQF